MNIAALVSGGVDSSVALRLLKDEGHDITAFYLKIWLEDELSFLGQCPWEEDISYVESVCHDAGVPFEVVPFQKEYWDRIVSYVIEEARAGRTPNPDVFCNALIKFGAFYDAFGKDYDKVATGHYAQVEGMVSPKATFSFPHGRISASAGRGVPLNRRHPEKISRSGTAFSDRRDGSEKILSEEPAKEKIYLLKKSPDPVKDQTYFLSQLTQSQVSKALFPVGKYLKEEVRGLAKKYDLPNAKRKDSQGICFLGRVQFDQFLKHYLGTKEGDIVDWKTGKALGKHQGYWFHTIGQRKGLGLSGGPWYVAVKDIPSNTIFVSNEWRSEEMARSEFSVDKLNWIAGVIPKPLLLTTTKHRGASFGQGGGRNLTVKIRHGEKEYPCEASFENEGRLHVKFDGSDRGIAAGQIAAFYDGEYCFGGGMIV